MTPEERAEARRLVDAATPGTSVAWISYALRLARKTGLDFADIEPDLTLNAATETDAELFAAARTLVPRLLDALEAAERERDEARALRASSLTVAATTMDERDSARAQVATMKRSILNALEDLTGPMLGDQSHGAVRAVRQLQAALRAAGVET